MTRMASDKLSDRLKGMLLESSSKGDGQQPSRRPLIEVVHSGHKGETLRKQQGTSKGVPLAESKLVVEDDDDDEDNDDDDDGPPPISFHNDPSPALQPKTHSSTIGSDASRVESDDGRQLRDNRRAASNSSTIGDGKRCTSTDTPSLAEQLLEEAASAKQKQQQQRTQKEQQRAKKSTFGMKKGFLNSSSSSSKKQSKKKASAMKNGNVGLSGASISERSSNSKSKKTAGKVTNAVGQNESNLVYELDSDGNMIPSQPSTQPSSKSNNNPLHLPEVQSAMLSHLQTNSDQWATPDLLDTITQSHPKLARGMADPRYMVALQGMQTNPKETLEQLKKTSPEIVEWLMEFCGVMGDHFVKLGGEHEKGEKGGSGKGKATPTSSASSNDGKVREMGPLEKKALKKHQMQAAKKEESIQQSQAKQQQKQPDNSMTENQVDDQVSSILANDELRSILLDPQMQQIMEECSTQGGKLRYYMGHDEYGPKLRRLMAAGLIRLG